MAKYQAGMLVVYGNLGVREIETVGPQSFCGEPAKDYYTLRPYFSDSHDRSYIPTEKEDVLRPVSPAEQITVDLEKIKTEELPAPVSRTVPEADRPAGQRTQGQCHGQPFLPDDRARSAGRTCCCAARNTGGRRQTAG